MSRRFAGAGLLRRRARSVASSGTGPAGILGSLLVEYFDARAGVGLVSGEVDTWTGQRAGTVLTAPASSNRLVYEADGVSFLGLSVLKSAVTGSRHLANQAVTPFWATATRPYLMGVLRVSTVSAGNRWAFRSLDAASSEGGPSFLFQSSIATLNGELGGGTAAYGGSTAVHVVESFVSAAGDPIVSIDGVDTTTAGPFSITGARTRLAVGGATSGGATTLDASHAAYVMASAVPSAAQRVALREWAFTTFGSTPASILGSNLREWWDARYGVTAVANEADTWSGQKLGLVLSAPTAGERPPYVADGTEFMSRPVIQTSATDYIRSTDLGVDLHAAGSRPYVACLARLRAVAVTDIIWKHQRAGGTADVGTCFASSTTPGLRSKWAAASGEANGGNRNTSTHWIECWLTAAGEAAIAVDGGTTVVAGTGITLSNAVRQLAIGNNLAGATGPVSMAVLIEATAAPTAQQRLDLRSWAQREWGAP